MIYFNENACAEFSRIAWVIKGIDRGSAAPNTGFGLEYGDIDGEWRGIWVESRVVAEVVDGRGSGCTSAWKMCSVCYASQKGSICNFRKCKRLTDYSNAEG